MWALIPILEALFDPLASSCVQLSRAIAPAPLSLAVLLGKRLDGWIDRLFPISLSLRDKSRRRPDRSFRDSVIPRAVKTNVTHKRLLFDFRRDERSVPSSSKQLEKRGVSQWLRVIVREKEQTVCHVGKFNWHFLISRALQRVEIKLN